MKRKGISGVVTDVEEYDVVTDANIDNVQQQEEGDYQRFYYTSTAWSKHSFCDAK